jgi:hypothetical protein
MAIQPVEFTNEEILQIFRNAKERTGLILSGLDVRLDRVIAQALSTKEGFYVAALGGPKFTEDGQLLYGTQANETRNEAH